MKPYSAANVEHLAQELESWAQNEEMVDQGYTPHGHICLDAADELRRLAQALMSTEAFLTRAERILGR